MKGRFVAALVFAAVASLALVPWLLLATPILGFGQAMSFFVVPGLGAYLFAIAPSPRQGLRAALLGALAAATAGLLTPDPTLCLFASAVALSVLRSGLLYRRRVTRSIAIETGLGIAGVLLAGMVGGGTVLSWALSLWLFLLVQSLYFLMTDADPRRDAPQGDAFEAARAKALALL